VIVSTASEDVTTGSSDYRPIRIKAPAAMARTARIVVTPEAATFRNGNSPVKMSQIPNKSMPSLAFILDLLYDLAGGSARKGDEK
jgi:hypothetical protein